MTREELDELENTTDGRILGLIAEIKELRSTISKAISLIDPDDRHDTVEARELLIRTHSRGA